MPPEDLKTDIEVLKNSFSQMNVLIGRIDTTIEKLTEVSNGINRMIAVHESRLSNQEDITREIFNIIEQRRQEYISSIDKLRNSFEKDTESRFKELEENAEKSHEKLGRKIDQKIDELSKEVEKINRWRYIVIGAALSVGALVSKPLGDLLKIFGITLS
jgi:DNA anti-recombination protein RmuC